MLLNATATAAAPARVRANRRSCPAGTVTFAPAQSLRAARPGRAAALRPQQRLQVSATATVPFPPPHSVPVPVPAPAPAAAAPIPATLPAPKVVELAINAAVAKAAYSWQKTMALSFTAGAQIALGGLLMTIVAGGSSPLVASGHVGLHKFLAGAIGLPTGLSLVVLTGGELFTGNTFVMTLGWLAKKVSGAALLKNWAVSFVGNLVGALFIAALAHTASTTATGPWVGASVGIATAKVSFPFVSAFVKGVLCNWLVCSAVWIAMASQSAMGKMLGIFLPVSMFVTLGFEHSVANMFLIPQGMLNGAQVSVSQFLLNNILPVTLGNIVGGAVLLGYISYFAHHTPSAQR